MVLNRVDVNFGSAPPDGGTPGRKEMVWQVFSVDAWQKVWVFSQYFSAWIGKYGKNIGFALLIALFLGIVVGLMATSGKKILTVLARVYVEFIQNTPVLLQMCFLYYALAFSGHSIGIVPTGILALGIYTGLYGGK